MINNKNRFKELDKILRYHTKNRMLLNTALTHSSYANVHRIPSYERLEYLGDGILSFISREYLFTRYKDLPEGQLTKIQSAVLSERSLAEIAEDLKLFNYILYIPEYEGQGPKRSMIADVIESVIAAIYLDSGMKAAKKFVIRLFSEKFELARKGKFLRDYITEINELAQKKRWTVEYRVVKSFYNAHNSLFIMQLYINNKPITQGRGENKKDAMRDAAKAAFEQGKIRL